MLGRLLVRAGGAALLAAIVVGSVLVVNGPDSADSAPNPNPPPGFTETVFLGGVEGTLVLPTAVRFSPDGRIFVAEKSGLIKVFDGADDNSPTVFADLRRNVFAFSDRGLLGLELHPDFPANPSVYVLYSHDAPIGGTAPRWSPDGINDNCPSPPGPSNDGCVTSSRLSKLTANGDVSTGAEQVLIEDWCQQYEGHSIGTVTFGNDGMLYAGGGEGALASKADYGDRGGTQGGTPTPANPCGDPPSPAGTRLRTPTAEGGSLRSQDLRTPSDPQTLDGTIVRLNPDSPTGAAAAGNPFADAAQPNKRRIIAYGLRNPFRFVARPGSDELWIADVGLKSAEEINVLADTNDATVENFGWPCYEGTGRQSGFDAADLNLCESLYAQGGTTSPFFRYTTIGGPVVPGESCANGKGAISGITFYEGGNYPAEYDGALFFTDYTRQCIWVMPRGTNGDPDPEQRRVFLNTSGFPVDLQIGPDGDIFYADIMLGRIMRIRYSDGNQPPKAVLKANRTSGLLPLAVNFDGSDSSDPDAGQTLTYAWDLDGDGAFDDSSSATPTRTYTTAANISVKLRVRDPEGSESIASVLIRAGNRAPVVTIQTPTWQRMSYGNRATAVWGANGRVRYQGTAVDPDDGPLAASRLQWDVILQHCSTAGQCHEHHQFTRSGVTSGSFTAPDHDYPAYLEIRLRATDSQGLSTEQRVRVYPRTVKLTIRSTPPGIRVNVGGVLQKAPFTRRVIYNSSIALAAGRSQQLNGTWYRFAGWSDRGARIHTINPRADKTYRVTYKLR